LATEVSSAASRILRQEAGTDAWTEITRETSFAALATTSGGEVVVFPLAPPGRGLTLAAWTSAHGLVSADAPGVEPHSGLSFSMDGRRAAWSTCRSIANLSRIENGRLVHVIESGSAYSNLRSAFLSDGRLILISDRDGDRRKLWVASADASGAREVPGIDDPKSLKVLGTKALVSTAKGIWHVDFTSGETVKQLTTTPSDVDATFTHDGSIVLQRAEGTTHGLYLLREGRAPERLPFDAPRDPDGSPIEDKLVFVGGTGAESRLFVVEAGVVRPFAPSLQPALYATPTFSKDGKQLAVVRGRTELVLIDVATERVLRADVLTRGTPGYPVFANDGSLYTNGYDWIGDVWIADVE
jgi:hypothetical protein